MRQETLLFYDVETTSPQPHSGELISIAMIATDTNYNEISRFVEMCSLDGPRIMKNVFGKEIDRWPDPTGSSDPRLRNSTDVHGILWKDAKDYQKPIDMYRKMWMFLHSLPQDTDLRLIFHSEAKFDLKWLLYRSQIHAPKLYQYINKRVSMFEYDPEKCESQHTVRYDDTMSMARAYIRRGKDVLKKTTKIQKRIDKLNDMLTKERKTPLKADKIQSYKDERAELEADIQIANMATVELSGWGLSKICKDLNLEHNHHVAVSDTEVLIPIHKYLKEVLCQE